MKYIATVDGHEIEVQVNEGEDGLHVLVGEGIHRVDMSEIGGRSTYSLLLDDRSYEVNVHEKEGVYLIRLDGRTYRVSVEDERLKKLRGVVKKGKQEEESFQVTAPMPGMVVAVEVSVGDEVRRGDGLAIIEAMKMENEIKAQSRGRVKEIRVQEKQVVEQGEVLIILERLSEPA